VIASWENTGILRQIARQRHAMRYNLFILCAIKLTDNECIVKVKNLGCMLCAFSTFQKFYIFGKILIQNNSIIAKLIFLAKIEKNK
jgi:hypothetical protein